MDGYDFWKEVVVGDVKYLCAKRKGKGSDLDRYDGSTVAHAVQVGFWYAEYGEVVVFGDGWCGEGVGLGDGFDIFGEDGGCFGVGFFWFKKVGVKVEGGECSGDYYGNYDKGEKLCSLVLIHG